MIERMNFYSIFRINPDGSIEPLHPIRISGVQMVPGVRFSKGVSFSGIDLSQFIGRDFAIRKEDDILIIEGIF